MILSSPEAERNPPSIWIVCLPTAMNSQAEFEVEISYGFAAAKTMAYFQPQ